MSQINKTYQFDNYEKFINKIEEVKQELAEKGQILTEVPRESRESPNGKTNGTTHIYSIKLENTAIGSMDAFESDDKSSYELRLSVEE